MKKQFIKLLALPAFLLMGVGLGPQLASGQCVSPPSGIVAWWPGEGNANDIIGTNNGTLVGGVTFTSGEMGQAFNLNGYSAYIQIPDSPALDPTNVTVEAWVRSSSEYTGSYIIAKSDANGVAAYAIVETASGGVTFYVMGAGSNFQFSPTSASIGDSNYHHVAGTYDGSVVRLFVDGIQVGNGTSLLGPIQYGTFQNGDLLIGTFYEENGGDAFAGSVDELSIYNRALSPGEIAAIYAAGSSGKCIINVPVITQQPQSQLGYWGKSVTFSVSATNGIPPLSYQWLKDSAPILNATNSTLVLTNLQATNAGAYIVIVTDSAANSVTSAPPAILTVNSAGVSIALYAGVTIDGVVGQTYGVQSTTNLGNINSWAGLTNLTLNVPEQIWYDSQPASLAQRYYRVVPGPISIP